jgi:hypothetical protein
MGLEDKFDINLNQNLWGLIVAYVALGSAEHWGLKRLFWLSLFVSIGFSISVLFTVAFYTINYCKKNFRDQNDDSRCSIACT